MVRRERTPSKAYQFTWCVLLSVAFSYIFIFVMQFSLQNWRYSAFYVPKTQEETDKMHNERVENAENYFAQLDTIYKNTDTSKFEKERLDICVVIASVDRSPRKYLTINLASLLRGLSNEEREKFGVKIIVLDTETDETKNREAKEMKGKFPELFEVVSTTVPDKNWTWYQKEILDYSEALKACHKYKPKMGLILEDDVMATNHYVTKFFDYLYKIPEDANYMDIKLFYPEFYCGFNSYLEYTVIVIIAIITSFILTTLIWNTILDSPFRTRFIYCFMFFYILGICISIPLIIGKQNIMHCWEFGVHPFKDTAFTNAVAYHYTKLDFLSVVLAKEYDSGAVDLILDNIAKNYGYSRYLILPNLFQHIGVYSSNVQKNQGDDYHLKTSLTFVEDY